jgi:hypothetical protein
MCRMRRTDFPNCSSLSLECSVSEDALSQEENDICTRHLYSAASGLRGHILKLACNYEEGIFHGADYIVSIDRGGNDNAFKPLKIVFVSNPLCCILDLDCTLEDDGIASNHGPKHVMFLSASRMPAPFVMWHCTTSYGEDTSVEKLRILRDMDCVRLMNEYEIILAMGQQNKRVGQESPLHLLDALLLYTVVMNLRKGETPITWNQFEVLLNGRCPKP